jgi:hypothetical protein
MMTGRYEYPDEDRRRERGVELYQNGRTNSLEEEWQESFHSPMIFEK